MARLARVGGAGKDGKDRKECSLMNSLEIILELKITSKKRTDTILANIYSYAFSRERYICIAKGERDCCLCACVCVCVCVEVRCEREKKK